MDDGCAGGWQSESALQILGNDEWKPDEQREAECGDQHWATQRKIFLRKSQALARSREMNRPGREAYLKDKTNINLN